jgi:hypothetical protein
MALCLETVEMVGKHAPSFFAIHVGVPSVPVTP